MLWKILLFSFILLLLILSFTQFEIRREIEIFAPPEKIWAAIIDFKSYKNWNTQLEYLGGEIVPQGNLHLKLSAEGADPYEFKPVISHWKENEQFAWLSRTSLPRVFDGEHFFELKPLEDGKTLLINREVYSGILSLIIRQLPMMKNAPQGFEKMNQELKTWIERPQ
ncbi:MAG: SRPBCC domain-containing protein [Bacteroidia bacterium]|nr:SRPBCC domain-containing protein [Bacteroidia bacterium]